MTTIGKQAQRLRNTFWREICAPVNVPVRLGRKGWTLEASGSRERAVAAARALRALYLANADDPFVCQAWAQCEMSAVTHMVIAQIRA